MYRELAAVSMGLVVFGTSSAQDKSAAASGNLAALTEVVVTAEKIAEPEQKVPLTLTVLSEQQLQQMGAQSFIDYAGSVPAMSFESLAPGEQRVLIRGVSDGVDTGLRAATQNTTGIYIDDMVVSNNETAPDLNLFDVERIEVLKGPQGTLYGDGSVGGLLRVITNKADPTRTAGALEAIGGKINEGGGDYSLNGMYNAALVQDKLAVRVVGQYRDNQGYIDDVRHNLKDVNNMTQTGARASVRWLPQQNLSLTASALYQKTSIGNANDFNNVLGGGLVRNSYYEEPKITRFNLYNLTVDWNLRWASLLSSTSYAVYDHDDHNDFTDFLETAIEADFGVPDVVLPAHAELRQHSHTVSEELRLTSPTDQRLSWIGGLYYYKIDETDSELDIADGLYSFFEDTFGIPITGTPLDVGPVPDVAFQDFDQKIYRRQFAVFGEASLHFTDRLTGTIGARWFTEEHKNEDNPGGIFQGSPVVHLEKDTSDHSQVFRFRVADQITPNALVYALASQGYRVGGLNPLNPETVNNPDFPQAFEPDKLWNYELGWKTLWLDRRLKFNAALFYIDWKNEQVEVALPGGFSIIANAGKTTIKGVEADLAIAPLPGLELGVNGSYIRAQLDKDLYGESGELIGKAGDQLTGVPKTQGSLFAQWDFPLATNLRGVLRGDLQYVGQTSRYFAHDSRVPAPADQFEAYGDYTLLNLRGGLQWPTFSVILFVNNVTDRRAALFRGLQGTSVTPTRDDVYVAQPRTIGIDVTKRF
jgi:iron complex outermembrane recepter protein